MTSHFPSPFKMSRFCGISHESDTWAFHVKLPPRASPKGRAFCHSRKRLRTVADGCEHKRNFWRTHLHPDPHVLACVWEKNGGYSVCLAPARVRSNCKVQGDGSRTKTKLKLGKQTRGRKRGCWLPRSGTTMLTICLAKHTCWVPQKLQDCANILIDQCPPHPRLGIQVPP